MFRACERVYFPAGKSSNVLRGAFGLLFQKVACAPQCPGAKECELRASCPYARMFEPSAIGPGPSGFADWPRPFVFRATHLDGRTVLPGEPFWFDLNLFDLRGSAVAYLKLAFAQLGTHGLGPGRGRAELVEVRGDEAPLELSLDAIAEPVRQVRVRFLTPTELKSAQGLTDRPEFAVLAGRIRDRVSQLRALYGEGPLDLDFRGFGERAALVRMTRCELRQVEIDRRSSRTGQVHSLGGFVGEAEYEGELSEFVPWLRAAKWTGVGRQTVWGKGALLLVDDAVAGNCSADTSTARDG